MTKEELADLRLYLKSGNEIPVERVTLAADKFKNILDRIDAQAAEIERLKGRIETLKAALMDFICDAHDDPRAFASAVYLADDELAKEQ